MYFGRSYKSTMTGAVWRPVSCEKCMHEFAYQITVSATGTGVSPYFLNNSGAQSSAQERAKSSFEKQVKEAYATVPCPECGHVQSQMVERDRQIWKQRTIGIIIAVLIMCIGFFFSEMGVLIAFAAWVLAVIISIFRRQGIPVVVMLATGALGVLAFALYMYRPEYALPGTIVAGALAIAYSAWRAFVYDLNADLDKNKQKRTKHPTVPVKRNIDSLSPVTEDSGEN